MRTKMCLMCMAGLSALANCWFPTPSIQAGQKKAQALTVEFNRDIRPILSNHCFVCHGPDNHLRKAKLRLDDEKDAHAKVIVKGEPLVSELFRRLVTDEAGQKMPPAKTKKELTKQEIQLIYEWIEQ